MAIARHARRATPLALTLLLQAPHAGAAEDWPLQATLLASDAEFGDGFGNAVDLDGVSAVVGAPAEDGARGMSRGAGYVFVRSGSSWVEQQKLVPSEAKDRDQFGDAVAIDADTVLVGAWRDGDTGGGRAFVFTRSGSTWTEQQKLTSGDLEDGDSFGEAVALDGDTALVTAPAEAGTGSLRGAAYVFVRGGSTWTEQQKLTPSDAADDDLFGQAVALDADTAIVGSRFKAEGGIWRGAAYVFVRSGSTWTEQQKLTASDALDYDTFGAAVSIDGDTAIIGAPQIGDPLLPIGVGNGKAYVFVRSGSTWTEQQKLTASDAAYQDDFGAAVAVSGDAALVGADLEDGDGGDDRGAAYLFARSGASWAEQQKLASPTPDDADRFGFSVSLQGATALAGAHRDDTVASNAGSAYVFGSTPAVPALLPVWRVALAILLVVGAWRVLRRIPSTALRRAAVAGTRASLDPEPGTAGVRCVVAQHVE